MTNQTKDHKMSREEAGRKGAEARHAKSPEEESRIAKQAAATRKQENPNAFKEMGQKGGASSRGGGRPANKDKSDT